MTIERKKIPSDDSDYYADEEFEDDEEDYGYQD